MNVETEIIGREARAFSGVDYSTRAIGTVIGYSDRPMVCIETPDGEHVWWVAALTEFVDELEL
jgi:hypothetical protein